MMKTALWGAILALGFAAPTYAQVAEVRAGLTEFDEETTGLNWGAGGGAENSIGINAEIVFNPLLGKTKSLRLHPYIGGMVNLSGDTSYAAAGVMLRNDFSKKFYGELGIGLAVHDGTINSFSRFRGLNDITQEEFDALLLQARQEISFGSRVLFRPHVTLGYRIDDKWAAEIFMDHLSNGQVFGDGLNQGVDNLGIRASRRF